MYADGSNKEAPERINEGRTLLRVEQRRKENRHILRANGLLPTVFEGTVEGRKKWEEKFEARE